MRNQFFFSLFRCLFWFKRYVKLDWNYSFISYCMIRCDVDFSLLGHSPPKKYCEWEPGLPFFLGETIHQERGANQLHSPSDGFVARRYEVPRCCSNSTSNLRSFSCRPTFCGRRIFPPDYGPKKQFCDTIRRIPPVIVHRFALFSGKTFDAKIPLKSHAPVLEHLGTLKKTTAWTHIKTWLSVCFNWLSNFPLGGVSIVSGPQP